MKKTLALLVALTSLGWSETALEMLVNRTLTACNDIRSLQGLSLLKLDQGLCLAATQHSQEMDSLGYFGHHSPVPQFADLATRLSLQGCYQLSFAENLYRSQNYSASQLPALAVQNWLDSPVHRKNLLNPRYNRVGLGLSQRGGTYTLTQDLAYEAIEVTQKTVDPAGQGYRLQLQCKVTDGPTTGAIVFGGKRCFNWQASPQGDFVVDFQVPGLGRVGIAQTVAEREWSIETEFDL